MYNIVPVLSLFWISTVYLTPTHLNLTRDYLQCHGDCAIALAYHGKAYLSKQTLWRAATNPRLACVRVPGLSPSPHGRACFSPPPSFILRESFFHTFPAAACGQLGLWYIILFKTEDSSQPRANDCARAAVLLTWQVTNTLVQCKVIMQTSRCQWHWCKTNWMYHFSPCYLSGIKFWKSYLKNLTRAISQTRLYNFGLTASKYSDKSMLIKFAAKVPYLPRW